MSQTLRQRRELHAVSQIGAEPKPVLLTQGAPYLPASAHAGAQGLDAFVQRMVQRGLKLKGKP